MDFPPPGDDLSCDVLLIGGDITGATAAWLRPRKGAAVILLESSTATHGKQSQRPNPTPNQLLAMATTKTSGKVLPQPERETPEQILNEEPPEIVAGIDEGAEVASASEREAAADDYEANARLDDLPEEGGSVNDFSDEQDISDRPDSAAMLNEEGDE